MRFHEAAAFLFDLRRFRPSPGIDATAALLSHVDDPHEGLRCVQIAGSNGKGSTARMVERVLREAGLSVGLYTSPHLADVRERVRVDGRKITESAVAAFVTEIEDYATDEATEGNAPTFFETMTALALWEFGSQDVDVAVLEVGIGGRLDATSVVDPAASAVTSVTLEHTDFLGETVDEIARDKAAVAPVDRPLVTATTGDALAAIRDEVDDVLRVGEADDEESESPAVEVTYEGRSGLEGEITLAGVDWRVETALPTLGAHQAQNAGVAAALVRQVAAVDDAELARGLRNAHWPGRFEVMGRDPIVVLDGAHNPGGCRRFVETLGEFDYKDLHAVVGAMTDKDHAGIATAFAEAGVDRVTACRPSVDRAEDEAVVARAFERETAATVGTRADVATALADALDAADSGDCVVVAGSLYAVREARTRWDRPVVEKDVDAVPEARTEISAANVTRADARRAAGEAVNRTLQARVRPDEARRLREALLAAGGECAVSALASQDREYVEVVMLGTVAEFDTALTALEGGVGMGPLVADLRDALAEDLQAVAPEDWASATGTDVGVPTYPWEDGTAIMGILNVTPDSFHDGGEYNAVDAARERAERMVEAGVDVLDVGGESTRPGADPVSVAEERSRVVPVIEALADLDALVSVDTRKAEVARAALDAGADVLNDVSGLEDPEMRLVAADHDVPVIVMHSIETPVDPDTAVDYDDVVADVLDDLTERVLLAEKAGLDRSQIIVDPGLGFGKTAAESFELLGRLGEFRALGCPVMVGHSHKSMFELVGGTAGDAYEETIAATAIAAQRGADLIRVHDVENVAAVRVAAAAEDAERFTGE